VEPTVLIDAYKVGGIVLLLLIGLALIVWQWIKDGRERESRLSTAIENCQKSHAETAANTATLIANNTNAMESLDATTKTLTQVMRERPCLKEPTPPGGAHIPR
jgi:uncharacterized protein HemX